MIPVLLFTSFLCTTNSDSDYVNRFHENKSLFESTVDLITNKSDVLELESIKEIMWEKCRVDSIDVYMTSSDKKIYIVFLMSDSAYYPSTESNYRAIIYQQNDELPDVFVEDHNKKLSKNWFYVTNNHHDVRYLFFIATIVVFIIFVWSLAALKILFKKPRCQHDIVSANKKIDF